ncbi:MAG: hypothetical protein ACXIUL_10920 [Wenzhouxiangella sp.]
MNASLLQTAFAQPHAWLGALALVSFWTAALARKGSQPHRYAGRIFLLAMLGILITAIPLTVATWLRGQVVWATFLAYLVILVAVNCLNAWRAIRFRSDFSRYASRSFRVGAIVLGLAGVGVMTVGAYHGAIILMAFGLIGPLTAWQSLRLVRRGPDDRQWWLRSHFGAMIGNGIATHIAFFQIGLARVFADLGTAWIINIAWLLPLVVGIVASVILSRRYQLATTSPAVEPAGTPRSG